MYTGYDISEGHIYGPQGYTLFRIRDGHIYGLKGYTHFYIRKRGAPLRPKRIHGVLRHRR